MVLVGGTGVPPSLGALDRAVAGPLLLNGERKASKAELYSPWAVVLVMCGILKGLNFLPMRFNRDFFLDALAAPLALSGLLELELESCPSSSMIPYSSPSDK